MFLKPVKFIKNPLSKFKEDEKGVAAIEFSLIMLVVIALLFGTIDAVYALTAKRKVSLATHSMADLIAREPSLVTGDSQAIARLGRLIITPFPSDDAQIKFTAGQVDSSGQNLEVAWSCAFDGDTLTGSSTPAGSSLNLPSQLTEGTFLVVAETSLDYNTMLGHLESLSNVGNLTLTETSYFQSRSGIEIELTGGEC